MLAFKSIRTKMLLSFSIIVILIILLGTYVFNTLSSNNSMTEQILEKELPLLIADEQLAIRMSNRVATSRGYIITGETSFKDMFFEHTEESEEIQNQIMEIGTSEEFNDLITRTVEWRNFTKTEVFEEFEAGNEDTALSNLMASTEEARSLIRAYSDAATNRENQIVNNYP